MLFPGNATALAGQRPARSVMPRTFDLRFYLSSAIFDLLPVAESRGSRVIPDSLWCAGGFAGRSPAEAGCAQRSCIQAPSNREP